MFKFLECILLVLERSCILQFNLVDMFCTRMLRKSRYFAGNACVSSSISKRFEEREKKVILNGFLDNLMQVINFLAHYLHCKQVQEWKKSTELLKQLLKIFVVFHVSWCHAIGSLLRYASQKSPFKPTDLFSAECTIVMVRWDRLLTH